MTGNDADPSDFTKLEAGKLLPGCSIPIGLSRDVESVHAFAEFRSLPIDGLSRKATRHLADSLVDVARSLKQLHAAGVCYGRITSTSFHNRGTAAVPEATLWIDPSQIPLLDSVHHGDAEAMYWTVERLQSGAAAKPADDWYALGIVAAEIALSSSAVHKIWELSRADGKFVSQLIKNLKRSRVDRPLKTMAIDLIRGGAEDSLDEATLSKITSRSPGASRRAMLALMVALPIALALAAWNLHQRAEETGVAEQRLSELTSEKEALQRRVDELEVELAAASRNAAALLAGPAGATESSTDTSNRMNPTSAETRNRRRWSEEIAGRPLEQAVAAAADLQPASWSQALGELRSIPGQKQWRIQDLVLRRLVQQAVDAPWNAERFDAVTQRVAALDEAHAKWLAWARSDKTIDEIRTQHDLMPSGLVKGFLGAWLAEALEVRSFEVRVRVERTPPENEFLSHLIGFETPSGSGRLEWQWQTAEGTDESIEFNVGDYRVGDALAFWMDRDSSIPFWDSTVIEHRFESPLIVWQLNRGLRLEDSQSGYAVTLSSDRRFGPPAKLESAGDQTQQRASGDRPVVDPMDELPFDLQ